MKNCSFQLLNKLLKSFSCNFVIVFSLKGETFSFIYGKIAASLLWFCLILWHFLSFCSQMDLTVKNQNKRSTLTLSFTLQRGKIRQLFSSGNRVKYRASQEYSSCPRSRQVKYWVHLSTFGIGCHNLGLPRGRPASSQNGEFVSNPGSRASVPPSEEPRL